MRTPAACMLLPCCRMSAAANSVCCVLAAWIRHVVGLCRRNHMANSPASPPSACARLLHVRVSCCTCMQRSQEQGLKKNKVVRQSCEADGPPFTVRPSVHCNANALSASAGSSASPVAACTQSITSCMLACASWLRWLQLCLGALCCAGLWSRDAVGGTTPQEQRTSLHNRNRRKFAGTGHLPLSGHSLAHPTPLA